MKNKKHATVSDTSSLTFPVNIDRRTFLFKSAQVTAGLMIAPALLKSHVAHALTSEVPVPTNRKLIDISQLGMNGERFDPIIKGYHLGQGYRVYNPRLMRFHSKDSLSPFGGGGINPYSYCLGDPINLIDPTGHLSKRAWLGIGIGTVSILFSVFTLGSGIGVAASLMAAGAMTSATALTSGLLITSGVLGIASGAASITEGLISETQPQTADVLGWLSLGCGLGSLATGIGACIGQGVNQIAKIGAGSIASGHTSRAASRLSIFSGESAMYNIGQASIYRSRVVDIVNSHGAFGVTLSNGLKSGSEIAHQVSATLRTNVDKSVKLVSCYSANGGRYASQAQRVADVLRRPVTGYYGVVSSRPPVTMSAPIIGTARTFTPQAGLAAKRTQLLNTTLSNVIKPVVYAKHGITSLARHA